MEIIKKRRIRWVCAVAISSFLFITAGVFCATQSGWKSHSAQIFSQAIQVNEGVQADLDRLRELNQLYLGTSCDHEMLQAMRVVEFNAAHLHNFGYIEAGKLTCSTALGLLSNPVDPGPSDFKPKGSDIEFTQFADIPSQLNEGGYAMQIKIGDFQAYIRPVPRSSKVPAWIDFGVFAITDSGQELVNVHGYDGIIPRGQFSLNQIDHWYEEGRWVELNCYSDGACGVASIDLVEYVVTEKLVSVLAFIFVMLVTALNGVLTWQLQKRYLGISKQLSRGLRESRIECLYQPIMDVDSGKFERCEVLCRWRDEHNNVLSPAIFIDDIENNCQTKQLTELVIKKAVSELKKAQLLGEIKFAINVFPDDIASGHVENIIDEVLPSEYHSSVSVEITEREVENISGLVQGIDRLHQKSIQVSIDDFGTGYSNFQHLSELKADYIKIDKSFIWGMEDDAIRGKLVQDIVNMAKTLDLKTVAEGVETQEQLTNITKLGVDLSQGYFHAKPLSIGHFSAFIKK